MPRKRRKNKLPEILLPAHFVLCKCRRHGRIVFSDGSESRGALSKTIAFTALKEGIKNGKISEEEVMVVRKEISTSPIPDTIVEALMIGLILGEVELKQVVNPTTPFDKPTSRYDAHGNTLH